MAGETDVFLGYRQSAAGGDTDLFVDEINAGDGFGHGMLDLKAGVHFNEIELAILVEKLDGTGAAISHVGHGIGADHADPLALHRN